ncbi:hypothetical protein P153DRAFT_296774 [Dothidotthia symphoricarpi CBS 119687]|uniref:F-box domain-containing protein n=1 Tax=Dothidotthia symphoricarpi CBS 119687 TaxID=1392245 RepID=A0A6A6A4R6_9PLEO|nr:uncharacterized protein P153DRAFT_296774 [Dothidotthia symphoricarpi CBS 119687]KAF2126992.1 hypothetical protein P153DRAFT_296774 [Dothidotthia symphoricarpi CBS 119687]
MADAAQKKSGLRAMFGMRTGKEAGPRKKLSKKGFDSDAPGARNLDPDLVANSGRQHYGSFAGHSSALTREDAGPPTYEEVTGLPSRTFRDNPYSGIDSSNFGCSQQSSTLAEYRRNSEGLQQLAAPVYNASNLRSASVPFGQSNSTEGNNQYAVSQKAPRSKLSKTQRQVARVDDTLDKDTGERKDLTDMMHAFTFNEEVDSADEEDDDHSTLNYDVSKPDGTALLGSASPEVWLQIADFMSPLDVANLSSTCRTMYARLGRHPYKLFLNPSNRPDRIDYLLAMDHKLPQHLFCFPCATWHLRTQPGRETLKPQNVLNPLFDCPNMTNHLLPPPRIRITEGRLLPFAFVQMARRSRMYGADYGISSQSLGRRWKDPYSTWTHESMYHVTDKGHVLMRVKSQIYVEGGMTDAAKRMLIFSRGDYTPYFSVCSHWKNGLLTSIPKCALDHIPKLEVDMLSRARDKVVLKKGSGLVSLCNRCRPMRRCPECPTEYLFELKMVEDKSVKAMVPERFRQALIATRWSDLGPGRSPIDKEWAAIVGENKEYDGLVETGRRAVSGVFESAFSDAIPGQRMLSMNPHKIKADETAGECWY